MKFLETLASFYKYQVIKHPFAYSFLFTSLIYFFTTIIFGTYYESYEGMYSVAVQGVYTDYAVNDWQLDIHFLVYALYAQINSHFPEIQVYGFVLSVLNFLTLFLLGSTLIRYIKPSSFLFAFFLFLIVAVENIVNLNTTRIAFTLIGLVLFWFFKKDILSNCVFSKTNWIVLCVMVLFISILRIDAVTLASIIFLILAVLYQNFKKYHLIIFLIPFSVFTVYNITLQEWGSEALNIFYYNEFDYIDRENIDQENLTDKEQIQVDAINQFLMFDEPHFSYDFTDKVLKNQSKWSAFLNGLNYNTFIQTLQNSITDFLSVWYLIIGALIIGLLNLYYSRPLKHRNVLRFIFFMLFPVLVCFYIITPARFLSPYYIFLMFLYTYNIVLNDKRFVNIAGHLMTALIFILTVYSAVQAKREYKYLEHQFRENIAQLKQLSKEQNGRPVVVDNIIYSNFFPVNPLRPIDAPEALLMNFYFFNSFPAYQEKWKAYCNCNPLSIKEKIKYVANEQLYYIISENHLEFLTKYLWVNYNLELKHELVKDYDKRQKIYHIGVDIVE